MSDQVTPIDYQQAAAAAAEGDELMRAGQIQEAYAIWRSILNEAERQARAQVPDATEFLAFVQSLWVSRTGINQSWYRCWPEEQVTELKDIMRRLGVDPDARE